jgi:hypothetical protein
MHENEIGTCAACDGSLEGHPLYYVGTGLVDSAGGGSWEALEMALSKGQWEAAFTIRERNVLCDMKEYDVVRCPLTATVLLYCFWLRAGIVDNDRLLWGKVLGSEADCSELRERLNLSKPDFVFGQAITWTL